MGATASTVRAHNEVVSSRKRGETFIPLHNLTEHLRLFQHHTGGDILVLVDEDADAFLTDPTSSQYQEIFISRRGTEYLDQMKLALAFQAQKALEAPASMRPTVAHRSPNSISESAGEGIVEEQEPTLYQKHHQENPHLKFKHSDPLSNQLPPLDASLKELRQNAKKASGDKREYDQVSLQNASPDSTDGGSSSVFKTTATGASPTNKWRSAEPRDPAMLHSVSSGALGRSSTDGDSSMGLSTFSSLSKSNDRPQEASRGVLLTGSASVKDFHRHEQEMLHRARNLLDAEADAKSSAPSIHFGIASPPDDRSAKEPPASPRPPRLSPRVSSGIPSHLSSPQDRAPSSGATSPRSSGRHASKEEGKDSKESSEPTNSPRIPARKFVPVAYLPPSAVHRERIVEEDKRMQQEILQHEKNMIALGHTSVTSSIDFTSRDPSRAPSFHADLKSEPCDPAFSPRSFGMFCSAADGKPPSLRSNAPYPAIHPSMSNVSHVTSGTAGIASLASVSGSARDTEPVQVCPVCGTEMKYTNTAQDKDNFDRHVNSCTMRKEMKSILASIDQNLVPKLDELADSNRKQLSIALSAVIGRVADEFDQTSAAHSAVKRIVTSVLRINYDTSQRKISKVEDALRNMQERVSCEISDGQLMQAHGSTEAIRKITAFNNLARILEQTADKLALKRHNITLYRKYLIGIQDFKVLRKLGKGAFASVYLARVKDTKKLYAMKVLSKADVVQGHLLDQVMKERTAMVMSSRYPDYFVELLFAFQSKNELFLVMEYMQGGDCLSLLSSVKRLPEHVAQHFISQVCLAVRHLHAHGVIHRDIKPDNVMITARGHAKLGDFGSVCPIHPDFLRRDPGIGTFREKKQGESLAMQSLASRSDSQNHTSPFALNLHGGAAGGGGGNVSMGASSGASASFALSGVSGAAGPITRGDSNNSTGPNSTGPAGVTSPLSRGSLNKGNNGNFAGSMSQLTTEISTMASLAFRKSSKSSSSASNSLWLDDDFEQPLQTVPEKTETSSNWTDDSSTSSLFFNKVHGGPVMQNTFDIVGNYFYASPEMAGGTCILNQAVDWWAVGVLLFHMLSGTTPFEGLTKASTLENIENKLCDWEALPEDISRDCRDFLHRFLAHNYETRLGTESAEDVLNHPFFSNIDFATLYEGYGPYFPRPPMVTDGSDPAFYSFSVLSEEESKHVPYFEPRELPRDRDSKDSKDSHDPFSPHYTNNTNHHTNINLLSTSTDFLRAESKHSGPSDLHNTQSSLPYDPLNPLNQHMAQEHHHQASYRHSSTRTDATTSDFAQAAVEAMEEDIFQDFDFHPF